MKKTITRLALLTSGIVLFSSLAYAQTAASGKGIESLAGLVKVINERLLTALSMLFMSAALVAFFYGVVQYIWGAREGNDTKIKAGNQFMLWGVIALFVMFSVYGFITFGQKILFPNEKFDTITIPRLNVEDGGNNSGTRPDPSPSSPGPLAPQPLGTCPDGTVYYSPSERNQCGNASLPQPLGTCPDGTVYYSPSERNQCQ